MKPAATEQPDVQPLADDNTVVLDSPIRRGVTTIDSITLRKPSSGELRGVSLVDLLQMDVASLIKVVPRISSPTLTAIEVSGMDPADLLALSSKISGFLLQKSAKTDASLVA
ncbi:phage tail assembly protein [Pseudomonas proteolytica]|uniref:phage tail assembly protein n=1 Tax=Pseudomonas proteolytica TaxID=219574 RepID=UPI0008957188|nr:phage tail assembly protein [Pseudomonas proteolytica]KAA8705182.1 phage tail assembly protein [Pseudomonas proteolytica]TWR85883.1 phage tail assembly protein [Pseudomonas proteolytica]SED30085.1 Phage tail assembly chaperone protein, E, or 41 or 14 [Pseudomonas proteolytica]